MTNPTLEEPTASERAQREAIARVREVLERSRGHESMSGLLRLDDIDVLLAFTQPTPPASLDVREVRARGVETCVRTRYPTRNLSLNPIHDADREKWEPIVRALLATQERVIPDPDQSREIEILRRALCWLGDPQRMATTREEWQRVVDDAVCWVKANPEEGQPSFSTFAALERALPEAKGVDAVIERCAQVAETHAAPCNVPQIDYDQACHDIAAAIREYGRALPYAGDAMVLVPREPTKAMLDAVAPWPEHWEKDGPEFNALNAAYLIDRASAASRWSAMLTAATQQTERGEG